MVGLDVQTVSELKRYLFHGVAITQPCQRVQRKANFI